MLGDETGLDTPALRKKKGGAEAKRVDWGRDGRTELVLAISKDALLQNGDLSDFSTRLVLLGSRPGTGRMFGIEVKREEYYSSIARRS